MSLTGEIPTSLHIGQYLESARLALAEGRITSVDSISEGSRVYQYKVSLQKAGGILLSAMDFDGYTAE